MPIGQLSSERFNNPFRSVLSNSPLLKDPFRLEPIIGSILNNIASPGVRIASSLSDGVRLTSPRLRAVSHDITMRTPTHKSSIEQFFGKTVLSPAIRNDLVEKILLDQFRSSPTCRQSLVDQVWNDFASASALSRTLDLSKALEPNKAFDLSKLLDMPKAINLSKTLNIEILDLRIKFTPVSVSQEILTRSRLISDTIHLDGYLSQIDGWIAGFDFGALFKGSQSAYPLAPETPKNTEAADRSEYDETILESIKALQESVRALEVSNKKNLEILQLFATRFLEILSYLTFQLSASGRISQPDADAEANFAEYQPLQTLDNAGDGACDNDEKLSLTHFKARNFEGITVMYVLVPIDLSSGLGDLVDLLSSPGNCFDVKIVFTDTSSSVFRKIFDSRNKRVEFYTGYVSKDSTDNRADFMEAIELADAESKAKKNQGGRPTKYLGLWELCEAIFTVKGAKPTYGEVIEAYKDTEEGQKFGRPSRTLVQKLLADIERLRDQDDTPPSRH